MKAALMTDDELQRFANDIKEVVFHALEAEDVIKDAKHYSTRYAVIVYRRGWLGRLFDTLRSEPKEDHLRATVLKRCERDDGRVLNDEGAGKGKG